MTKEFKYKYFTNVKMVVEEEVLIEAESEDTALSIIKDHTDHLRDNIGTPCPFTQNREIRNKNARIRVVNTEYHFLDATLASKKGSFIAYDEEGKVVAKQ